MTMIEGEIIWFVIWLTALILISFALKHVWSNIFPGRGYQIILFPGVIIHEFSHALGCLLSGAKVDEISLFSSKGSYVKHGKPKLPLIGSFIISFAPIAGGIAFLWLAAKALGLTLPQIDATLSFALVRDLGRFAVDNWELWTFWLFIYLTISIVICLVPSKQDISNSAVSALIVLVIFVLINQFSPIVFDPIISTASGILAIAVFFGLLALILSFPVLLAKRLI